MARLKIVSEDYRSKVVDAETGEIVENVVRVDFTHDCRDQAHPRATIELIVPDAEIVLPEHATEIGPVKLPPFLLFSDFRLRPWEVDAIRQNLEEGRRHPEKMLVIDSGLVLYQLVDGQYRKVHEPEAKA